jgi:3',5'-cyclic AMP phosphodiesterase CpdA
MTPLRLAQISDFHFTKITWNPFRLLSKRLLGNLNWVFARKNNFSETQLDALPKFLKSLQIDCVLLGGDFTTTSLRTEYERAETFVKSLPAPWLAIPGNHDHYTYRSYRQRHFYRYFTNQRSIDHKVDFFTLKDHAIEAHRLVQEWWVIALDTALATNPYASTGLFSEKQEEYLEEILAALPANASILLFNHYPFFQNDIPRHRLVRGVALEAILRKEPRIKAYLHGHSHRHTIADLQPSGLPVILDSGCSADCEKASWNLLEIDNQKLKIDTYRWENEWQLSQTREIEWTR